MLADLVLLGDGVSKMAPTGDERVRLARGSGGFEPTGRRGREKVDILISSHNPYCSEGGVPDDRRCRRI